MTKVNLFHIISIVYSNMHTNTRMLPVPVGYLTYPEQPIMSG